MLWAVFLHNFGLGLLVTYFFSVEYQVIDELVLREQELMFVQCAKLGR